MNESEKESYKPEQEPEYFFDTKLEIINHKY